MSSKLRFFILIGAFVFVSLQYGDVARRTISGLTTSAISGYLNTMHYIGERITEHFNQRDEIRELRVKNRDLERSALLSMAFAGKLNGLLREQSSGKYKPEVMLVEAISYAHLSDYYRVWLKMDDFNASKIYGLVSQGNSAGIVVAKDDQPLALLQGDPQSIFSVYLGKEKMPGVAVGNKEYVHVKYIPMWMNPQVGDEVVTSGLDKIFFTGIPVGKVIEVFHEESYQTAVVKPYATPNAPSFFHVVK